MVRHIGKGFKQNRLCPDIGRVVIGSSKIGLAVGEVLGVFRELIGEGSELGQVFDGYKDIDTADRGSVVAYRLEDCRFPEIF